MFKQLNKSVMANYRVADPLGMGHIDLKRIENVINGDQPEISWYRSYNGDWCRMSKTEADRIEGILTHGV